jgi:hypothetical protein
MIVRRVVVVVCASIFFFSPMANAQQVSGWSETVDSLLNGAFFQEGSGLQYSIGTRKFFNSFTSYQFPNPFEPGNDPLSRLEFPIDQWFVGGKVSRELGMWSLQGQAWINVTRDGKLKMQDSDWDDQGMPDQKTIFSESHCKLNKGFLLDVCGGGALPSTGLLGLSDARAIAGYRYEFFYFTAHDGRQMVLDGDTSDLIGDGIDFKQHFHNFYFGLNLRRSVNLTEFLSMLPVVKLELQGDYGVERGMNEDFHLLREGERVTTERTRGHCWHALASMAFLVPGDIFAVAEVNFKRSITHGSHQLTNPVFFLDFSFNGSRVWSDQISLTLSGKKTF